MANLVAMRAQLAAIRSQLVQMPVFSTGRPDSDAEAGKQAARLEKIANQLALILRDLKSSDHLAQMRLDNLKKLPAAQRWPERQSAEQKARDVAALAAEADRLDKLARDLLRKNGVISPVQATKKAMDLIEDLEKHLPSHVKSSTQQPSPYPVYTAQPGDTPHVESLVPLVTLLYVAVKKLKEKWSKDGPKS